MTTDLKKELKEKESLIKTKDTNKVIVIFFILGISLLTSTIINLGFVYLSLQLGTREKIFVTRQGETEIAEEKDPHYRTDKAIKETVSNFLYLTYEWNSKISNSSNKDPGVQIKGDSHKYFKVPTKTYISSYLLEVGFRKQFLEEISKSIPSAFYQGNFSSTVKIYFIGNTERIDKNLYRVRVIMTRTDVEENAERDEKQINRIIYLQATEPYRLVLGNQEPSMFKKQLNQLLKNGLIIYKISPEVPQQ